MKRIFLFAVFFGGVVAGFALAAETSQPLDLDGREVVVRIYGDWESNRSEFEAIYVQLKGGILSLESVEMDDAAVAIVLKADQEDEVVKGKLGVAPLLLRPGKRTNLSRRRFRRNRELWTFKDGAGNPIVLATGEMLEKRRGRPGEKKLTNTFVLNESGECEWIHSSDKNFTYYIVLSHPDYGVHRLKVPSEEKSTFRIPIVPEGTEAYERSMRGFVVDSNGNPISGTYIKCRAVYLPGATVIEARDAVSSDEQGWFHMYPYIDRKGKMGKLVPPNSKYHVRIEAPIELGLVPFVGTISNDSACTIEMNEPGYFHTFVFENEDGTPPKISISTQLCVCREGKEELRSWYSEFKRGLCLPAGTYKIEIYDGGPGFLPVEVTKDSPERLVFKRKPKKSIGSLIYSGRVVHGITGEPMPGAFVIEPSAANFIMGANLSQVRSEQWKMMHGLPVNPTLDHPSLKLVREETCFKELMRTGLDVHEAARLSRTAFNIHQIVRSDQQGRFEIRCRPEVEIRSLIAFEEDYLGIRQYLQGLRTDPNARVEVPVIPLFPAAKVRVRLSAEGSARPSVVPRWIIDTNDLPDWAGEPWERQSLEESPILDERLGNPMAYSRRLPTFLELYGQIGSFTYSRRVSAKGVQTFHVPAGISVRLQLVVTRNVDNKWEPLVIPQTINLSQGETLDLGSHEIKRSLQVFVRVVNSAGEPVEGAPVRNRFDDRHWLLPYAADKDGRVRFNVYRHSKGKFFVSLEAIGQEQEEAIHYEIGGVEDDGREFTLKLSDEIIYHLFKQGKEQ